MPIEYYAYLSASAFLTNLTPPNMLPSKVQSESKYRGHESNSETKKLFY